MMPLSTPSAAPRRPPPSAGLRPALGLASLALALGCVGRIPADPTPRNGTEAERVTNIGLVPSAAPPHHDAPSGRVARTPAPRKRPAGIEDRPRLALGTHGAVSSQDRLATEVGLAVLQRGGNAVDAAIAVGFALAVTHPPAGNVGGGGFMVVRLADGTTTAIDYRETAPEAASRDMFLDPNGKPTRDSVVGPRAAGIPGTVAGLALAHRRFGSRPWRDLVMPAVELARSGHELDAFETKNLAQGRDVMRNAGQLASARHYEHADGTAYRRGDRWVQRDLAEALATIAADPEAFYRGPLAATLVAGVRRAGGIWTESDLARYAAVAREPMRLAYRDHEILTMPLPSAGGIVMRQILRGCDHLGVGRFPWHGVEEVHRYVEIARRAYADRNAFLGDPAFVRAPVEALTSQRYIDERMSDIDALHATPSSRVAPGTPSRDESPQTTHFSVIDELGNAVSNTYTLNDSFGAKFVVPGTGILLNNEMDDFAVKPGAPNLYGLVQGEANAIAPGKRMLSSMTPTIVVKDGDVRAILGSPGGPTITTTVVQLTRALLDYGLPLDTAVAAPRIHHQWLPDAIVAERRTPAELLEGLRRRGHDIQLRDRIGNANVIEVDPLTRGFRAVADVDRGGAAAAAY